MEGIFGLFALERFGFGPREVGLVLVVVGTVVAVVQMALTGPATKRFGERWVIKASLLGLTLTFLLLLVAFDLTSLLIFTGLFAFTNSMLRPSIASLISKETEIDQGFTLGLNSSFMSLGRFTGPLLAGFLFDIRIYLPYLVGSVIMFLGFLFVQAKLKESQAANLAHYP
jgi:DHA1 family multidrug resistance protein-like MFS transporter